MNTGMAQKEKQVAARNSVFAAAGLTVFKIVVGILTNSLGILAEAAHSGLDLAAAAVTYFAVRVADKPADREHPYGHGKVENLSALFETLLLLATSAWIIYEAVQRLFFKAETVEISIWAFIVMGTSIIVDINRSRMLYKAARKYNSQALEADALHFSTDIWSSAVVILGLIGVTLAGEIPGLDWLHKADAVAALAVAVIVIFVSGELGLRTVKALLDSAPDGMAEKLERAAESIPFVVDAHAVRVRSAGAYWFVNIHVNMDGKASLEGAHSVAEKVEAKIRATLPNADVHVHVEPVEVQPDQPKPAKKHKLD